jgi:hypothetical protein
VEAEDVTTDWEAEAKKAGRALHLVKVLGMDADRAKAMAEKLGRLSDEEFRAYAGHTAKTLAELRRTVRGGNSRPDDEATEKVRAAVTAYMDDTFGVDDGG